MWKLVVVLALAGLLCCTGAFGGAGWWWYSERHVRVSSAETPADAAQPAAPPADAPTDPVTEGRDAYTRGDFDAALRAFDAAVQADPQDEVALSWRGRTYAELKRPDRALPDLEEAARALPDDLETWRALAYVRAHSADDAGAIEAYSHALKLAPTDGHLLAARADARFHDGDRAGALADAQAACDGGTQEGCVLRDRITSLRGR